MNVRSILSLSKWPFCPAQKKHTKTGKISGYQKTPWHCFGIPSTRTCLAIHAQKVSREREGCKKEKFSEEAICIRKALKQRNFGQPEKQLCLPAWSGS